MATSAQQLHHTLLQQLRQRGVLSDPAMDAAFAAVPRHLFLPDVPLETAYSDNAVPIKSDNQGITVSSSSQPRMMALMLQQAGLKRGDNVLEIGTATGYNAAIMQHIVGPEGRVTTLELDNDLTRQAQANLHAAGYANVNVVQADAITGYAPRASYDHIIATVGVWDVPPSWLQQVKPNGNLVVPIWLDGVQTSAVFRQQPDGSFLSTDNRPCSFVSLRGQGAGPERMMRVGTQSLYLLADELHKIDPAALHMLLSDDYGHCHLETVIDQFDAWYGFQLYLMLNEPEGYVFALYFVPEGQKAYGMEHSGIALFTPGSAAFAGYHDRGNVHCFAGADAVLAMQTKVDEWKAAGRPLAGNLHIRLLPKTQPAPTSATGKLYERRDHTLHVWLA